MVHSLCKLSSMSKLNYFSQIYCDIIYEKFLNHTFTLVLHTVWNWSTGLETFTRTGSAPCWQEKSICTHLWINIHPYKHLLISVLVTIKLGYVLKYENVANISTKHVLMRFQNLLSRRYSKRSRMDGGNFMGAINVSIAFQVWWHYVLFTKFYCGYM